MRIETKDLTPEAWPDLERLFGRHGAFGGCWCMYWRIAKGEKWRELGDADAKRRFKRLVTDGSAHGVLAYADGEPVGWCAYGPRREFPRLERARTLTCGDVDRVWSLPCFFVKAGHRGQGVAGALLRAALAALAARGARVAEAYPVRPSEPGKAIPAAFAWTGTRALFDAAGFRVVGNRGGGRERVRRALAPRRRRP